MDIASSRTDSRRRTRYVVRLAAVIAPSSQQASRAAASTPPMTMTGSRKRFHRGPVALTVWSPGYVSSRTEASRPMVRITSFSLPTGLTSNSVTPAAAYRRTARATAVSSPATTVSCSPDMR
ncbi:putative secreted protein [Candidatus Protofrankia californiensis]|uniref:Putative secreted protein n=1 Tax=Candidatus Protofrankia californiensis TaxID=1839754 RepID=A0A1C3P630_9ACTN|nr:putative secreted protein [Candidatus Protofrankia californiensis]